MDVYVSIFRMKGSLSQTHWHLVFSFLTEKITSILSRWHWGAFSRVALWLNQKEILSDLQQHQSGADRSWTVCVFWSFTACDLNFNVMLSDEHFSGFTVTDKHILFMLSSRNVFLRLSKTLFMLNTVLAKHMCTGLFSLTVLFQWRSGQIFQVSLVLQHQCLDRKTVILSNVVSGVT